MYKDKEEQREADRERQRRYRDKLKGVTKVGVTMTGLPEPVTPKLPANFSQLDCECRHCQNNRASGGHRLLNHGPHKTAGELMSNELNRVSLPGDVDYARTVNA